MQGPAPPTKTTARARGAHRTATSAGAVPRDHLQLTSTHTRTPPLFMHAFLRIHTRPRTSLTRVYLDHGHTHTCGNVLQRTALWIYLSPSCESNSRRELYFYFVFFRNTRYIPFRFLNILGWIFFLVSFVNFSAISPITESIVARCRYLRWYKTIESIYLIMNI